MHAVPTDLAEAVNRRTTVESDQHHQAPSRHDVQWTHHHQIHPGE